MKHKYFLTLCLTALMLLITASIAIPQDREPDTPLDSQAIVGPAISYQGSLLDVVGPVNENCDFIFTLFGSPDGTDQVGSSLHRNDISVREGIFTITDLDFGLDAFTGDERYLQVEVRCPPGSGEYKTLSPRHTITPTPYALSLRPGAIIKDTSSKISLNHIKKTQEFPPVYAYYGSKVEVDDDINITYGVYGSSINRMDIGVAYGIFGSANAPVKSYGVYGTSSSTSGYGVYGDAEASSGTTYGVYGKSASNDGSGVYGISAATTGENYGVYGKSDSDSGYGVYGSTTADSGTTYGVYGSSSSDNGVGVYGTATASSGNTEGVEGWSNSPTGSGVSGKGVNIGVTGMTLGTEDDVAGVYGYAWVPIGRNYGVKGETNSPDGAGVYAQNYSNDGNAPDLILGGTGGGSAADNGTIYSDPRYPSSDIVLYSNDVVAFHLDEDGDGETANFEIWNGANELVFDVNGDGMTTVEVLAITGGDLAEPFLVTGQVEPGMAVVIDPDNPGQLRVADKAHDRLVAGCVSGANGLEAGIILYQEIGEEENAFPVALSGRVYCWADASFGAIQPGDFLTTSDTPGHLMVVQDYDLAQGAIVGKAMSSLDEGQGLILILVTLQ